MTVSVLETPRDAARADVLELNDIVHNDIKEMDVVGFGVIFITRDGCAFTRASKTADRHRLLAGMLDLLIDYQRNPTT